MPSPLALPDDYRVRISQFPGGARWLEGLPAFVEQSAAHWSLTLLPPFDLSYNYVCPAVRLDGEPLVLKIGLPSDETASEQAALAVYAGDGCARLLDRLPEAAAFLLERLEPGTLLSELADDEAATQIAGEVMVELWKPAPEGHPFKTTMDWAAGLDRLRAHYNGGTGPIPPRLVQTAERLFAELHASQNRAVLLHGDLHHFNILRAERKPWLAIDPKGILGEREYEVGALLRNPDNEKLDDAALRRRTLRRIDQLSEQLGFDRQRLARWCYAQTVLSAWWSVEDGEAGWGEALRLAEVLADRV